VSNPNEHIVKDEIPSEKIIAIITPMDYRNISTDKELAPSFIFADFYDELILQMIDDPQNAFPIVVGENRFHPITDVPKNTTEVADTKTEDGTVYFGW
jgi:hypothetical protein